ncbi:MAG: VWA domain-containing protein [Acidobacteriota bacterium]
MRSKKAIILLIVVAVVMSTNVFSKKKDPVVQMAILLDTSGSMSGLIEQAKMQLWKIVNEMATAKRGKRSPLIEVALYEYGKSSIPASKGYIKMLVPLTTDLDRISEELFKLRTNGGSEYCGMVIDKAVKELTWNKSNKEYKVIFIAGNEPFTQGSVDYRDSCKTAISNGIIVNTIFCGPFQTGVNTSWKDGADISDGSYMNIDHNRKIVHIKSPQDEEIIRLGKELNKTYISYGKVGEKMKARQEKQDANAGSMSPSVMVERSAAKASKQYRNTAWDLVDAEKEGSVKVEEVADKDLPEEMRKMDKTERKAYVKKKGEERVKLQKKIQELKKEREKYVRSKRVEMSKDKTLDDAIINALKKQASKKKYKFENK